MHQKTPKIDFFAIFRNLQKKLPICKKKYAKILNSVRAVVTDVEKNVESTNRIFFTSAKVAPDCSVNVFTKHGTNACLTLLAIFTPTDACLHLLTLVYPY